MEDISVKEVLIAIIVLAISMTIAIFSYQPIQEKLMQNNILYQQSLKIDNDENIFLYSKKTNVGNVLSYGLLSTLDPQSIEEINGQYSIIYRQKQKYTMHIKMVNKCDSNGENCHLEPVTYYEWDDVSHIEKRSSSYEYLGVEITDNEIGVNTEYKLYPVSDYISDDVYGDTSGEYYYPNGRGNNVGNIRYYYYVLPEKINATMFIRFFNDEMSNPINENSKIEVSYNTIEEELKAQKNVEIWVRIIFYSSWFVVTVLGYFWLAYEVLDIY